METFGAVDPDSRPLLNLMLMRNLSFPDLQPSVKPIDWLTTLLGHFI